MGLSTEQLAFRSQGIGGSELSAILGISPFSGPLEVWDTKVYGAGDFRENSAMRLGTMMEPYIAEAVGRVYAIPMIHAAEYALDPGFSAATCEHLIHGTLRNKRYPRMLATPDYVALDGGFLAEIKCVGPWSGKNTFSRRGQPVHYPPYYAAQLQAQMFTSGIHRGRLCVFVTDEKVKDETVDWLWVQHAAGDPDGKLEWWAQHFVEYSGDLRIYEIPYSDELGHEYGQYCQDWWDRYVACGIPDPDWVEHLGPQTPKRRKPAQPATSEWTSNF